MSSVWLSLATAYSDMSKSKVILCLPDIPFTKGMTNVSLRSVILVWGVGLLRGLASQPLG